MLSLPDHVLAFMHTFQKAGYRIYLVGGAVRNLLLLGETEDWDFAVSARPEQILELFPDGFYNNTFGTVGIPVETNGTKHVFEVTTFRKESDYTDSRRPDSVEWTDSIEEDLARRDFTINAIAYDGSVLVDPFSGCKDLERKVIRAVGNPDTRFAEDALRLLRAVRFATVLSFEIEAETRESLIRNADRILNISWERIRDEFFRILVSRDPAGGVLLLRELGLLRYILPEVEAAFAIDQKSPMRHHKYDVGTHLVESLRFCPSEKAIVRFAALIHDIGKVPTYRKNPRSGLVTFYNHEVVGKHMAEAIAERFKLSNAEKEKLVKLVEHHQFTVSELQTDKALRRFIRNVGKENLQDMLDLRTGDRIGSGAKPTSWRYELFKQRLEEVQHEPFSVKDLKINGHDVMEIFSLRPSRKIGEILDKIFTEVIEAGLPNDRETLLKRLREVKADQSSKNASSE
ncbi:MAG: CCA tRNA nucleotidyltransferase [Patescibacteria group bacterium]|nr:CCA tRNA nucleotidyltransferase [Patescibacteria group bacterium]